MSRFKAAVLASLMFPSLICHCAKAGETALPQSAVTQFSDPYASPAGGVSAVPAPARKKPPAKSGAKETKSRAARAQGLDGKISLDNAPSATANKAIPDLKQDANSDKGKPAAGDLPVGLDLHWSAANDPRLNPLSTTEAVDSVRRNQNQAPSSPGNELDMGVKLPF
jgi:hypothetical protein